MRTRDKDARHAAGDLHPGIARYLGFSFLGANELVVLTEYFSQGSLRRHIRSLVEIARRAARPPSTHFLRPASAVAAATSAAVAGHNAAAEAEASLQQERPLVRPDSIRAYARQVSMTFGVANVWLTCCECVANVLLIRAYARQLTEALTFLHLSLKMSHRRVSASCVFLHDNGTVR